MRSGHGRSLVETRILQLSESQEGSWIPAKSGAAQKTRAGIPPEGWSLRSQTDSPDKSRRSKSSGNKNKTITGEQLRERLGGTTRIRKWNNGYMNNWALVAREGETVLPHWLGEEGTPRPGLAGPEANLKSTSMDVSESKSVKLCFCS